ncbi:MAG: DUF6472 family protein [Fusicatenibacter sp.]|nr:DUF6472 family protein [Lachnospiraceae bacterium]MDY2938466.1 DUF6472 family protein [Fusicatenibacter sp.]
MSKKERSKKQGGSCESCGNYVYDEEYECYTCEVDLDEDEMARFMTNTFDNCPYYQLGDEYRIVRKQM